MFNNDLFENVCLLFISDVFEFLFHFALGKYEIN